MPLYEYGCQKCGARIEKIRRFSDPPLTTCEKCGGKLERLLSRSSIRFKGSGWYVTDYARKSSPPEAGKSEGSPGGKPEAPEIKKPAETKVGTSTKESKSEK